MLYIIIVMSDKIPAPFKCARIPQVYFSIPVPDALAFLLAKTGYRTLIISGETSWGHLAIEAELEKSLSPHIKSLAYERFSGEPSPEIVNTMVSRHRGAIDAVVAVGGGSVIDAGKAVAAMLCENDPVERFLEGVGDLVPSGKRTAFYACPTTAGTGSEATKNAVLSNVGPSGYKKSLRHDNYIPDAAIIDPPLSLSCPLETTIASGLDALSQLLEAFTSSKANALTDCYALEGIALGYEGLTNAAKEPENISHREKLALAAFYSGIALANAGLGAVHGIAGPIGAYSSIPHGLICGKLLSPVFLETITRDAAQLLSPRMKKIENKTGSDYKAIFAALSDLSAKIPSFDSFGLSDEIISKAVAGFSNKNALVPLDIDMITDILRKCRSI